MALTVTTVAAATSANTASTLVRRDPSGNISAGDVHAFGWLMVNNAARVWSPAHGLFIGVAAGNNGGTGISNIGIGNTAMQQLTTGSGNVGIGYNALGDVTTGQTNVAIGDNSMTLLTTSSHNTAVGAASLQNLTSGTSNTAVGRSAMFATTTGFQNSALGRAAMQALTTGESNTAVGYEAGSSLTNGLSNVAVGSQSLASSTGGALNTALGWHSLYALTSGDYNTVVGSAAASSLTSGINNIIIGYLAGSSLTSGNGNIYVGSPGVASEFGVIRIGTASNNSAYIGGINGATIGAGTAVFVDATGRLGTITSSRRYKTDIESIADSTDTIMRLRPVTFRYRSESGDLQYGLIAEEVAAIDPSLVLFGDDGQPQTVRYHFLAPLLLAEVQEQRRTIEEQRSLIDDLLRRVERLEAGREN